ncbi:MAG: hypothetical protein MSC30_06235 [Gaiellaceae bacterium MAG52_C11]|nr:hypothetical protein [Candidatus Gaiellasilicea maunaloa]
MRRLRLPVLLLAGVIALVASDRRFGSAGGVGSTEPPEAEVPALPAPEREA